MPEPDPDHQAVRGELGIDSRQLDNVLVVRVTGEIDIRTAPQLQEALGDSLAHLAGGRVIIDLSAVTFFGSVGLAALAQAAQQADDHQVVLRIVVGSNRAVRRPIEVTGLELVLVLCESVEDAVGDVSGQEKPSAT